MNEVVIVEAVRTPIGRRNGSLGGSHSIDVLGAVQKALFDRSNIDPASVGQVVGGCVGQVGMQAHNPTRNAWLAAGPPKEVAGSTVDSACGSSQQAATLAFALVRAGIVDTAVACGVELMTRVPMGSTVPKEPSVGKPVNRRYRERYNYTTQFEGAELMARRWNLSRQDCDAFGKRSQDRAARAWAAERFATQIIPVVVPGRADDGSYTDDEHVFERDECLRSTTLDGLGGLQPVLVDGVHTAGSASQIADGAAAILMMTREKAFADGVTPLATVVDACLVGCDPVVMLEGPIPATRKLLGENGLTIDDIDVIEINEAFASVVLAWEQELRADRDRVNPNGGAVALGHPLGGTGVLLVTKAVHELVRSEGEHAIVTMCCGGGLGTGTLLRRA